MWIMTTNGMISCVRHRDDPSIIIARARSYDHLARAFPDLATEIFYMKDADYNYRLEISNDDLKASIDKYIENELDYDNFKNAVEDRNPDDFRYIEALHEVWQVFYNIFKGFPIPWLRNSTTG